MIRRHRGSTPEDPKTHWTQLVNTRDTAPNTNNQLWNVSVLSPQPMDDVQFNFWFFPNFPITTVIISFSNLQHPEIMWVMTFKQKTWGAETVTPWVSARCHAAGRYGGAGKAKQGPQHCTCPSEENMAEWQPELLQMVCMQLRSVSTNTIICYHHMLHIHMTAMTYDVW